MAGGPVSDALRSSPMRLVLLLTFLCACRPAPTTTPSDVDARLNRIEERLDQLSGVSGGSDAPASPDIRLLRVEQRLDKVITFLKSAVPPKLDETKVYGIPVDPLDPVIGPAGAAVTIVEAYEYLCPYCNLVESSLAELRRRYPRDVRVVSKYFVIHGPPAMPSGIAACAAARQGKFPALHAALWKAIWDDENNPADREQATEEAVAAHARAAGLDMKRYSVDVAGPCKDWLATSARTLQQFGAGGTPSFWINGRFVQAGNVETLAPLVDAELARVKASGVPAAKYYDEIVVGKGEREAVMISPFD